MKILKASDSAEREPYKPTKEDLERIRAYPDKFKMSGDGIFHTIQGEGIRLGKPITFVRLHFCNLACSWCDTFYTWQKTAPEFWQEPWDLPIGELHERVRQAQEKWGILSENHIYRVCFTGGEPMIQQSKIVEFLKTNPKYNAEVETNGTILPKQDIIDLVNKDKIAFNCSPKLANSGNPHLARCKPEVVKLLASFESTVFKFVCASKDDILNVLHEYGEFIPRNMITIMPEGVTKEENAKAYENMIGTILELGLATHGRLQNVIFDGARRGV